MNELFQDSQRSLEETSQQLLVTRDYLATTREHLTQTAQELHVTKRDRDEKEFLVTEHVKAEQSLLGEAKTVSCCGMKWFLLMSLVCTSVDRR